MGRCTECRHYDSRPQGGGAVCNRLGISGMYARYARNAQSPCGLEGKLFESRTPTAQEEIAKLREELANEQKLAAEWLAKLTQAEARIKAAEEQEPVIYQWMNDDATWGRNFSKENPSPIVGRPLYTRPLAQKEG